MKILLDENVDVSFRKEFPAGHQVYSTEYMGWKDIENGALLKLLEEHGFDCWIGVDKNLPYQQNLDKLPCLLACGAGCCPKHTS